MNIFTNFIKSEVNIFLTETERILEAGMNVNSIFARGDFKGNLLAIKLDASIS